MKKPDVSCTGMNQLQHIELGRPARPGQLILERRFNLTRQLIPGFSSIDAMLDIGCGNGAQTVYFTGCARRLIGVDLVPIHQAESTLGNRGFTFVRTDAGFLPFKDERFEMVTAFEVLEHFPSDRQSINETFRVLKKAGYFLLSVPNKWWIFESHGATVSGFNWIPWNRIPFVGWLPDVVHRRIARARIYTMARAVRLAKDAGFEILEKGYITAPLDVLPDGILRTILRKTLFNGDRTDNPFLAVNLFILCRKPI